MTSTPTFPRTPSMRGSFSSPGSPSLGPPFNADDSLPQQLQHLATQIVTQTVSSRAQLRAFGEQVSQLAAKQDELLGIARAEEARCVTPAAVATARVLCVIAQWPPARASGDATANPNVHAS